MIMLGCAHGDSMEALKSYVKSVRAKPARPIEPLPEVRPYQSFIYNAQTLRSPFVPPAPPEVTRDVMISNGIHPDVERRKELLENFPLDSLKMVGTLEQSGKIWAILVDSDGMVHRISKGNYVGQNHGKVLEISEEGIKIMEIVPNSQGGWQEREASMALIEQ